MKLIRFLRFALYGWLAGSLFITLLGLLWPAIFPGILRPPVGSTDPLISLPLVIFFTLVFTSLPSLIGGLVGGSLSREGGTRDQLIAAAIGGMVAALPFGCFNYWTLSGS